MRASSAIVLCAAASVVRAHAGHGDDSAQAPFSVPESGKSAASAASSAAKPEKTPVVHPAYTPVSASGHLVETFDGDVWSRWSPSHATKSDKVGGGDETFSYVGQWAVQEPEVFPGLKGDLGLVVTNAAAHHAISAPLPSPIDPAAETLVVQYEVKLQKGLECGGAYIKLLTDGAEGVQSKEFSDKTPYTIMFGPDRCGATNKVHLIFRYKSPKTGEIEEKHLRSPPMPKITKTTALYTLILNPSSNTYAIKINGESEKSGNLLEDFEPSFVPPTEIDDPEDKKPEDWVEAAKISDPDAVKPEDWDEDAPLEVPDEDAVMPDGWLEDEPATVPDPDAEKPEEWDDEEDGDWIPPSVPNPKCESAPGCGPWIRPTKSNPSYKGKWYAPLVDNPLYKGIWKAARIPNPAYYDDATPLKNVGKIGALGFEIWSMQSDILFDNIFIGNSEEEATKFAAATFDVKHPIEVAEEDFAKPTSWTDDADAADIPAFQKDPIGFARGKFQQFVNVAVHDPVGAFKRFPQTGAAVGVVGATLIGMIGIFLSALIPAAKPAAKKVQKKSSAIADKAAKKTDALTADTTVDGAAADAAPLTTSAKTTDGPVTRRSAAGKAKE